MEVDIHKAEEDGDDEDDEPQAIKPAGLSNLFDECERYAIKESTKAKNDANLLHRLVIHDHF